MRKKTVDERVADLRNNFTGKGVHSERELSRAKRAFARIAKELGSREQAIERCKGVLSLQLKVAFGISA